MPADGALPALIQRVRPEETGFSGARAVISRDIGRHRADYTGWNARSGRGRDVCVWLGEAPYA